MSKHLLAIAALMVAAPAFAKTDIDEDVRREAREHRENKVEVFGGAGLGNFTQDLGDISDAGVAWEGRVGFMPFDFVGGEIAYQGMNGNVDTLIAPPATILDNQDIVQHQITGDLKAGYPIKVREREVMPYGLVGLGYARMQVDDSLSIVGLSDDNALAVPLGAGMTFDITDNIAVDGRFTYNFLSSLDNLDLIGNNADSWTATVNLGAVMDLGGR